MAKKTSAEKLKKLVTKRSKTEQKIKKLKTKKTVPLRKIRTKIQEAKYKKTQKKINANPTAQANRKNAKPSKAAEAANRLAKRRMKDKMSKMEEDFIAKRKKTPRGEMTEYQRRMLVRKAVLLEQERRKLNKTKPRLKQVKRTKRRTR